MSLDGGIGNLLFQYAAAKSIAANSSAEVVLAEVQTGLRHRLTTYVGPVEFRVVDRWSARGLGSVMPPALGRFGRFINIAGRSIVDGAFRLEVGSNCAMDSELVERSLFLQGYFQHRSWFDAPLPGLLKRLEIHQFPGLPHRLDGVVGLHVRRGDFVRAGWALPLDYYSRALELARSRGFSSVLIASDDSMVRELLEERLACQGWTLVQSGAFGSPSAFLDFHLLARSGAMILSNSTFSWWAARLNEHLSGSDVGPRFAPARWFDGGDQLLDEQWIAVA